MQAALARERVDPVRVEPRPGRDRRVGDVAVDEDPRRALHAAVHERDQESVAAELHALVRLVLEHALVGDEELLRERERRPLRRRALRRDSGCGGAREVALEPRPQDRRPCASTSRPARAGARRSMATTLVAASASPMTRAASIGVAGQRRRPAMRRPAPGRVSGGLAGWGSRGGRLSVRAMGDRDCKR